MTTTTRTYYEVLWGIDESERATWIDYGDGMLYSQHAEANATRAFLEMVKAGRKAEFCVDGVHKAGDDFADEWAQWERWCAAQDAEDEVERAAAQASVEHKTVTHAIGTYEMNWRYARMRRGQDAIAKCSCGWKRHADNRDLARRLAKLHREENAAPLSPSSTTATS